MESVCVAQCELVSRSNPIRKFHAKRNIQTFGIFDGNAILHGHIFITV